MKKKRINHIWNIVSKRHKILPKMFYWAGLSMNICSFPLPLLLMVVF